MKVIATLRHYVGNEQQATELETMADRIIKAQGMQLDRNGPITFRLMLNYPNYRTADPKVLTSEVKKRTTTCYEALREQGISVDSCVGYGIGAAFLNAVHDYMMERNVNKGQPQIKALIDGNQFDVSNHKVQRAIESMSEMIVAKDWPLALALRDFVQLAANPYDDSLRRVEELYHLLVVRKPFVIDNPQRIPEEDIHPAYKKWGDIIPGLWTFNLDCSLPEFTDITSILHEDANVADLTKYQADPYHAMLLRVLSEKHGKNIYSEIVPTTKTTRGTRFNRDVITQKARELAKTYVGAFYLTSIEDAENEREMLNYFDLDVIEDFKGRALKGYSEAGMN